MCLCLLKKLHFFLQEVKEKNHLAGVHVHGFNDNENLSSVLA